MQDLEEDLKELYAQQKNEKQKELDAAQTASTIRYVFFDFNVMYFDIRDLAVKLSTIPFLFTLYDFNSSFSDVFEICPTIFHL